MRSAQLGFLTPRSMFIVVVMLAMLLIPLLWLGDKPVRAASETKKEAVVAQAPASAPPPAPAGIPAGVHNPEAFGMTWGLLANDKLPSDAVAMSCHGEPRDSISQAHAESCKPLCRRQLLPPGASNTVFPAARHC